MKIKTLIAVSLLMAQSIAAAEPAAEGPVLLTAGDLDGVTAAGFSTFVSAAAEAAGRYTMTTTRTDTLVRGSPIQAVQYGRPFDYAIASGGLAAAYTTGEGGSSTSVSTDDDTANFTGGITGSNINVTRSILGLTIQRNASMRFEGVTAYNHMAVWNGL